jgi:hypothetical protein
MIPDAPPVTVNDFDGAPVAEHNQWCHVCWERPANLFLNNGVFQPCVRCQKRGWVLVRVRPSAVRRLDRWRWRQR